MLDRLKRVIVDIVTRKQGCKATELVAFIAEEDSSLIEHFDVELIEQMVSEKLLVEVEYVLTEMTYRTKSFLLPPGTQVNV